MDDVHVARCARHDLDLGWRSSLQGTHLSRIVWRRGKGQWSWLRRLEASGASRLPTSWSVWRRRRHQIPRRWSALPFFFPQRRYTRVKTVRQNRLSHITSREEGTSLPTPLTSSKQSAKTRAAAHDMMFRVLCFVVGPPPSAESHSIPSVHEVVRDALSE